MLEDHPMGEEKFQLSAIAKAAQTTVAMQSQQNGSLRVVTPGGVLHVRWDENASASALGQLAFFAEFLDVSGLFQRWVESYPLLYTSPNAPEIRDVLGTWLLSILDGQRRYAHINGLRGDEVASHILAMTRIISDESLRRALKALAPSVGDNCTEEERIIRQAQLDKAIAWMDAALKESTIEALDTDWILDVDTTVKLLFGNQDGAEIGYNPTGRSQVSCRKKFKKSVYSSAFFPSVLFGLSGLRWTSSTRFQLRVFFDQRSGFFWRASL